MAASLEEQLEQLHAQNSLDQMDALGELVKSLVGDGTTFKPETVLKGMDPKHKNYLGVKAVAQANKDAPKIIENIIRDLESGKMKPPVAYQDPDQTQLKTGYEAQMLREMWSSGMDLPQGVYRPGGMPHLSKLFMAGFLGNYDDFMKILSTLSPDEVDKLLKRRESYLQYSPIFLPIIGARRFWDSTFGQMSDGEFQRAVSLFFPRAQRMHKKLLKELVNLGADVNVHDLAGYTPLHHCLTSMGNSYTKQMAEFLLDMGGANVNAVNRFGDVALMDVIMGFDFDTIKMLVKYGADPLIKNCDGHSPMDTGRSFPKMYNILRQGERRVIKKERNAAKEEKKLKSCERCQLFAEKRCSGCFLVWYCGLQCQRGDWTSHKEACKMRRAEYKEVETVEEHPNIRAVSFSKKTSYKNSMKPTNSNHFVIKVQVPLSVLGPEDGPFLCYNEKRDIQYKINDKSDLGITLKKAIQEQESSVIGKGYFYSVIRDGKHFIHPTILTPEKW